MSSATSPCVSFSSRVVVILKDTLPCFTTPMCICLFSCYWAENYIGLTTKLLSQHISDRLPSWLKKDTNKTKCSFTLSHVISSRHLVIRSRLFKVTYRIPINFPYGVRPHLLHSRSYRDTS